MNFIANGRAWLGDYSYSCIKVKLNIIRFSIKIITHSKTTISPATTASPKIDVPLPSPKKNQKTCEVALAPISPSSPPPLPDSPGSSPARLPSEGRSQFLGSYLRGLSRSCRRWKWEAGQVQLPSPKWCFCSASGKAYSKGLWSFPWSQQLWPSTLGWPLSKLTTVFPACWIPGPSFCGRSSPRYLAPTDSLMAFLPTASASPHTQVNITKGYKNIVLICRDGASNFWKLLPFFDSIIHLSFSHQRYAVNSLGTPTKHLPELG